MRMVTRHVRVVIYWKELPPINLHDLSMRWFCEVMLQIKYLTSPLAEDPWGPK